MHKRKFECLSCRALIRTEFKLAHLMTQPVKCPFCQSQEALFERAEDTNA